jgi:hypothetical protein
MATTILKPGILVSLKTILHGGVRYERRDLSVSDEEIPSDAADVARWETKRVTENAAEHAQAVKVRGAASNLIRGVCAHTAFGLLCPEDREQDLSLAVEQARKLADEHNACAGSTLVHVYVLRGRIASTDEEATRAIASEVRGLLDEMERGVRRADATAIRDAAKRAQQVGAILDGAQAEQVTEAIEQARKAARAIVKRIEKDGEAADVVLRDLSTASIERARFAFLDFDAPAVTSSEPALPAINVQRVAELDLGTQPAPVPSYAEALELLAAEGA